MAFVFGLAASAAAQSPDRQPVKTIADGRVAVSVPAGRGSVPVYVSADWSKPLPSVTRAVIVVHGTLRNADVYLRAAEAARVKAKEAAEANLLIVPQFLTAADIAAHGVRADVLRWGFDEWKDGRPAAGPAPLSSFDVFDAILARLADKTAFPGLRHVVVAGHSGGAQVVQRYAVAGRGEDMLTRQKIPVRYVVANPSSYLWFGDERPRPQPGCATAAQWKYGLAGAPPYVGPVDTLEERYIKRDVIYLLGDQDIDPAHPQLDRSCGGASQGESRYARGMQFLFALEGRHPNLVRHRIFAIPGVGHDSAGMFGSVCGGAALFDKTGCPGM